LDKVVDIEEGFPESPGRISYFYGHQQPLDNLKLYKKCMSRIAFAVNSRLASMDDPLKSGAIVIAPSGTDELLEEIKNAFNISIIVVIGNERLHSTIAKKIAGVTVLKAPLSGGYVELDSSFRKAHIQQLFRAYFNGNRGEFTPFSMVIPFDDLQLRRLGESVLAPSSALPLGATRKVTETRTSRVEPSKAVLLYSILGCSYATGDDEDHLTDANCAGFVHVTGVDEQRRHITVLSPCPGKLPSTFLILGSIKWIES
jgi:polyribonucleotide 5'-hydroxyl-kinase